ncbi:DUF2797 domain-containing protein [Halorarius halobius]|uniref:DUF2797 domain-containing protein n=1 Tax=Halorarius halobius TaxID=2962671 RepID=UPI0020CD9292|nr:DUF2797 domain-containing protein [Halorarius halobius]
MQIVGYEPVPDPALLVADAGAVERVPLTAGTRLSYALGERHCAGVVQDDRHDACPNATAPYCSVHADRWHEGMIADREGEHAVYLAGFAPATFKVGVTRSGRVETRLREQGADRGAHILTVPDGAVAREVESDIGETVGERVRVATKRRGLHREVDDDAWATLVADHDVIASYRFDYGFALEEQPVPETLASGTIRGVQGRLLVVETAGTAYAVDLRDLVGYEVDPDGDPPARQSSLGAF